MIDAQKLLTIAVEGGALVSAFAGIVAGVIMTRVTKHFGTGILASGFKAISIGIFFIAVGILFDAVITYLQLSTPEIVIALALIKYTLFIIGTYTIVIGSKKTGDKLESLTK